jgi:NAD(P)H-hydrate epimerase
MTLLTDADIEAMVPDIPPDAHKSTRGRLAVFAGSRGTTGAAALSAVSAARSRCGLVYLFADEAAYAPLASQLASVMVKPWAPAPGPAGFAFDTYDAFLAGPGWGFEDREPWLDGLISSSLPGVLDADALTMLAGGGPRDLGGRIVLTPHPGEMARLFGKDVEAIIADPFTAAAETSAGFNAVVVLKGHVTVITEPGGSLWVVDGMNPALGTGGSGDVLAGIVSGLLAGSGDPAVSAKLGALVHSRVAAEARDRLGWFLAEDLISGISAAFGDVS